MIGEIQVSGAAHSDRENQKTRGGQPVSAGNPKDPCWPSEQ